MNRKGELQTSRISSNSRTWQSYSRVPQILKVLCVWYTWKYVARLGFEPLKFLYSEFLYNTQAVFGMPKKLPDIFILPNNRSLSPWNLWKAQQELCLDGKISPKKKGFVGRGNDADTLGTDAVLVYDTTQFPAHVVARLVIFSLIRCSFIVFCLSLVCIFMGANFYSDTSNFNKIVFLGVETRPNPTWRLSVFWCFFRGWC